MITYLISYITKMPDGNTGNGRTVLPLRRRIQSVEDIWAIDKILTAANGFDSYINGFYKLGEDET